MTAADHLKNLMAALDRNDSATAVEQLNEYYRARLQGSEMPVALDTPSKFDGKVSRATKLQANTQGDWHADRCAAQLVHLVRNERAWKRKGCEHNTLTRDHRCTDCGATVTAVGAIPE